MGFDFKTQTEMLVNKTKVFFPTVLRTVLANGSGGRVMVYVTRSDSLGS